MSPGPRDRTHAFLDRIGVEDLPALTTPFDPGYDPATVAGHLCQSSHLMADLKISMACWMVAGESSTLTKIASARDFGVKTVTGGGPFEVAVACGELPAYLDLCAGLGFDRVECSEGFTELRQPASVIAAEIRSRGLEFQCELGKKHDGQFDRHVVRGLIERGKEWVDNGACALVVEARESATDIGLFDHDGSLAAAEADMFADAFGLDTVIFEAPDKRSQFALITHFGARVRLGNVRLEELLRVEIYRRGLHSDAFETPTLTPRGATGA